MNRRELHCVSFGTGRPNRSRAAASTSTVRFCLLFFEWPLCSGSSNSFCCELISSSFFEAHGAHPRIAFACTQKRVRRSSRRNAVCVWFVDYSRCEWCEMWLFFSSWIAEIRNHSIRDTVLRPLHEATRRTPATAYYFASFRCVPLASDRLALCLIYIFHWISKLYKLPAHRLSWPESIFGCRKVKIHSRFRSLSHAIQFAAKCETISQNHSFLNKIRTLHIRMLLKTGDEMRKARAERSLSQNKQHGEETRERIRSFSFSLIHAHHASPRWFFFHSSLRASVSALFLSPLIFPVTFPVYVRAFCCGTWLLERRYGNGELSEHCAAAQFCIAKILSISIEPHSSWSDRLWKVEMRFSLNRVEHERSDRPFRISRRIDGARKTTWIQCWCVDIVCTAVLECTQLLVFIHTQTLVGKQRRIRNAHAHIFIHPPFTHWG